MATLTLEYNPRSSTARKIIDVILAMDSVFKVQTSISKKSIDRTLNAIQDAKNGDIILCDSFDDYLKKTSKYA